MERFFTGSICLQKKDATGLITSIELFAGWGTDRATKVGEWTEKAMSQHKGCAVVSMLVEDITHIVDAKPKGNPA